MKRMLVVAALVVTFGTLINACESRGGGTGSSDDRDSTERTNSIQPTDSFPWDFPRDFTLKDVEVGQTVLSPAAFYGGALQRGEDLTATLLPIYCFYIKEVGHNTITVGGNRRSAGVSYPLTKRREGAKWRCAANVVAVGTRLATRHCGRRYQTIKAKSVLLRPRL